MSVNGLLRDVQSRNIKLWLEHGELKFKAPMGVMDEGLLSRLREHKQELVNVLASQHSIDVNDDQIMGATNDVSFAQQRLLFMGDTFGATSAYNMPSVYELKGELDVEKLRISIANTIEQHGALRSRFSRSKDGQYTVDIQDDVVLLMELDDVSHKNDPKNACEQITKGVLEHVFDVETAPLARFTLIKTAALQHRLVLNLHHVISDGWSHQLLWKTIWGNYVGHANNAPQIKTQYRDFVAWQNAWLASPQAEQQKNFWESYLSGFNELIDLPLDYARPTEPNYRGKVLHFDLPESATKGLASLNERHGCSDFISLISAFYFLLSKYSGQNDICIGTPVANRRRPEWESVIGCFANVVVLRNVLEQGNTLDSLLADIKNNIVTALDRQDYPFEKVVEHLQPERSLSHSPLFQVMFIVEQDGQVETPSSLEISSLVPDLGTAKFDLTVTIKRNGDRFNAGIEYNTALFKESTMARLSHHFCHVLDALIHSSDTTLSDLQVFSEIEKTSLLQQSLGPVLTHNRHTTIHQQILSGAEQRAEQLALSDDEASLTYAELVVQSQQVAHALINHGVQVGDRVGISFERGTNMVVALLGTLLSGAAYVPIDVNFPVARKQFICDDADLALMLCSSSSDQSLKSTALKTLSLTDVLNDASVSEARVDASATLPTLAGDNVAYVIYTSGSTGTPKGVMVSHANAINLFAGLDESLAPSMQNIEGVPTFRALTSISFDISVLELFWTLANGFHVIVERDHFSSMVGQNSAQTVKTVSAKASAVDFSLFYFASDQAKIDDPYRLLREGAKYADSNGLKGLWVPERHFHSFGGQFPNPSVAAAAVSSMTENIEIRAGSVVIPLHHPVRVAEEWSMVDNLSGGRAGIAFASGWHFNDFVLAPDNFENRHQIFKDSIDIVRKLWAGESVTYTDGKGNPSDVSIFPRPKRAELPIWITSAANPETFKFAGSIGANVLTHFLGQSKAELAEKIALYRDARAEHGFDPEQGTVSLMLHTYMSDDYDTAFAAVEQPFKAYLRNSINLLLPVAKRTGLDTEQDLDAVVEAGYQRYAKNSALFGTPESCIDLINELADIDVNEIACLVDFGVAQDDVIQGFEKIGQLQKLLKAKPKADYSIDLHKNQASHIQCTPSYAQMLLESDNVRDGLRDIKGFLVGGEALTPHLSEQLGDLIDGEVFNMYGPTETCVWSSVNRVANGDNAIGDAIANTQLYVLNEHLEPVPNGIKGELCIAGQGVTYGYWKRPGLTAENFVPNPFSSVPGERLYRTGDTVKRLDDGRMVFVGRDDNQVKVRGYRIELDEVRDALEGHPDVTRAAVIVRQGVSKEAAVHGFVLVDSLRKNDLKSSDLMQHLRDVLPDYMVPSALFMLDKLPYTPNGKLDIKALPTESASANRTKLVPAANKTEERVLAIWRNLLNLEQLGTQENFFELGGHSLLLGKLQTLLREECGMSLDIIELFKYPTVSSLAKRIDSGQEAPPKRTLSDRKQRNQSVNQVRNQMRQRNRRGK